MTYEIDHHYRNVGPEADLWLMTQRTGYSDNFLIATFYGEDALQRAEMFKALLEKQEG